MSSMAVDFNKGMRPNLYELMQEGPGGELQPATAETLGGVKIGRGVDVTEDGTISVTAPAPVDTYTKEEIDEQQEAQDYNITSNTLAIERLESDISDVYTKSEIDSQQQAQNLNISANAMEIVGIQRDIDSIKAEQITQNTNINVNAQSILAHTNQINNLADYNDTQDAAIAANTTAIAANTTAIANNATAIQNEATARESMDTTLAGNIAANVAAIAAEVAARESGDSELQSSLNALTEALNTLSETIASDSQLGLIKTDSAKFIETDENGVLIIGGRLGQFPDGGVYYPADIEPTEVKASTFLMSDGAKNLSVGSRTFGIMAGASLTCKNTAAGSTTYRVSNSQSNRFICAAVVGGRAALSQADAKENGTAAIVSIKYANGDDLTTPYFGATESDNDIIITLDRTVNPDAATKTLRLYGTNVSNDNILVGQGVGAGGGKVLSLGQATFAGGNQCIAFGNSVYIIANNSVGFGHAMLINKQFCFGAGRGHDFTNASNGTAAFGTYTELGDTTKLAVGNGTSDDARSNIFEVRDVSGASQLLVKSPNGTNYAITIDDSGNIVTYQV